jgi:hypothetical protein
VNQQALSSFIWSVADLLRGNYKQSEYGKVILPLTVLRRLDCVLEGTKADVLVEFKARSEQGLNPEPFLIRKSGVGFYNTFPLDMRRLMGDQDNIAPPASVLSEGSWLLIGCYRFLGLCNSHNNPLKNLVPATGFEPVTP